MVEKDRQGSDDAGDEAGQPGNLKVVVSIKGNRATIGVQQPSSDRKVTFEFVDGPDLSRARQEVLTLIAELGRPSGPSRRTQMISVLTSRLSRSPSQEPRRRQGSPGRDCRGSRCPRRWLFGDHAASLSPQPSRCEWEITAWSRSVRRSARDAYTWGESPDVTDGLRLHVSMYAAFPRVTPAPVVASVTLHSCA